MPFNGSGSFTVDGAPFASGTVVASTPMNAKLNDIAGGLSNAMTRDGQSPATANLPMGGHKITGLGTGTDPTDAAAVGQIADFGDIKASAALTSPAKWLLCYGQAISRTTYADLFAAISTQWGVGDGSTTFNVPDLRGRGLFGKDNMGGTAANRVTAAVSGLDGVTVGQVGGDQGTQQHLHTVNDPAHSHQVAIQSVNFGVVGGGDVINVMAPGSFISTATDVTGITLNGYGTGTAQNMPPAAVVNWLIYAGI